MHRQGRSRISHPRAALISVACLAVPLSPAAGQPIFDDGFEGGDVCGWSARTALYDEAFAFPDGDPWPAPWGIPDAGGGVLAADIQAGRARLRSVSSSFEPGRMVAAISTSDVEVRFTFAMADVSGQGIGFYVRQNGGWLTHTTPLGGGYAVFVEGFTGASQIGLWRERDGIEEPLVRLPVAFTYADGAAYRVRYRVNQMTPTETLLQAKVWPAGDPEPAAWNVVATDDWPALQSVTAGLAVDVFNFFPTVADGFVDDIEIEELCNPLSQRGPIDTVGDNFTFTEGPLWRDDHLLFTELGSVGMPNSAAILRHDPPAGVIDFRRPSDYANGLALDVDGELLACEHATRRVSVTNAGGTLATLVDAYQGQAFNSPNDLTVRSDGTVYFTDPSYGMPAHGQPREIGFNGLFRRAPDGTITAEWEGAIGANEPNGVALSPDQTVLYATDTQSGTLLAWDVAADGSLSGQRTVHGGLDTPDGLCIDRRGNVYVATWDQAIEVIAPDGTGFGRIPLARDATNCAFGGTDARTLYVTAQDQLYAIDLVRPGIP